MTSPTCPPLHLEEFLPYRLSLASNAVSQVIAQAYEQRFGLRVHEWRVMAVLAESGGLTQQDVVGRTKMDKVTVSRAARVLEQRRFVRRVPDPADARSLRLSLTKQGLTTYERIVPDVLAFGTTLLAGLSAAEVETMRELLRRLETAAVQALSGR